ncbi:MAG: nucleotidyltransferase family protein [Reichenbachiella sp.]
MSLKKLGNPKIAGLLLAAGSSSRLGQSKQLIQIENKTLLEQSLSILTNSNLNNVMTVLGFDAKNLLKILQGLSTKICINSHWQNGMGSTLKFGVRELIEQESELNGILISVCDQPFLTSEHINNLISLFKSNPNSIIASSYSNLEGVPVLFPISYIQELLKINDKSGAKSILSKFTEQIISVDFIKGEIDIDTQEDLIFISSKTKL